MRLAGHVSQPITVFTDNLVLLFGGLHLLFESRMGDKKPFRYSPNLTPICAIGDLPCLRWSSG